MSSPAFTKARIKGDIAERYVLGMFESWGLKVSPAPNKYHPEYDGIASGVLHGKPVNFKYEIKYDIKEKETGNIYLDIQSLNKSTASILCICLNDPIDTVLVLPLQSVLDYALNHPNKVTGGEFGQQSALVPKADFIRDLKPQLLTTKE